jgi:hypothetical protein
MTISAGFFFSPNHRVSSNRWNYEAIGLSVAVGGSLAPFAEAGARQMQERLGAPGRLVLSDADAHYEGEPGFLDLRTDDKKAALFGEAMVAIGRDLLRDKDKVFFFLAPHDWRTEDSVRFRQGKLSRFSGEFDDVFPWGECVLLLSGAYADVSELPVLFKFLPD